MFSIINWYKDHNIFTFALSIIKEVIIILFIACKKTLTITYNILITIIKCIFDIHVYLK